MLRTVIKDYHSIIDWFDSNDCTVCAADTETTSLNYYDLQMIGASFCNGKSACYIVVGDGEETVARQLLIQGIQYGMNKIKGLILHNANFDLKVFHKEGVNVATTHIFDTAVAAHLIDERLSCGLKNLAEQFLHVETMSYDDALDYGVYSRQFYDYATNDAIWTYQLYEFFKPQIKAEGLDKLFYEIEMPFQWVLRDMHIHGVPVDKTALTELHKEVEKAHFELTKELTTMAGYGYTIQKTFDGEEISSALNLNSSKQLVRIFKKRGLEITELTATGQPSVGKDTLTQYKDKDEFVAKLVQYKICDKLLNGFIIPAYKQIDDDGRIRPYFNDTGTSTGRLSCSEPNMQQLAKVKKEMPFNYRNIFVPSPGYKMIVADYSGQELRGCVAVTNDPNMKEALLNNKDLHLTTANKIFHLQIPEESLYNKGPDYKEYKEKYDHERHIGKNGVNFPILYGRTAYGICKDFDVTEDEAQSWIDGFFELYPKVKDTMERCEKFLHQHGYVYTLAGRKRHLDPWVKKSERQAFNFLIQGLCADMMRAAMNKVRQLSLANPKWDLRFLMTVHDEMVAEVKEEYVEEAVPLIKEAMETCMKLNIPLVVDISYGDRYGDLK